jgi:hypothetical protein
VIVLRKRLGIDRGQLRLFEEYRYFFSITNDRETPADRIVFSANDRCDQENLIAQLKRSSRFLRVLGVIANEGSFVLGLRMAHPHLRRKEPLSHDTPAST